MKSASSTEFGKTNLPIISMMHEWQKGKKIHKQDLENLGGSMRLGSYESILSKDINLRIYIKKNISMKDIDIDMKLITIIFTA